MHIKGTKSGKRIKCRIQKLLNSKQLLKKDGWNFNWRIAIKESPNSTFCLIDEENHMVQGAIQIKHQDGMLIMQLIELAPINIGSKREFEKVAGCLIAFACKEAIKLNNAYKGYVTFESKTNLIGWYKEKYFATQAMGQRMYIDPLSGEKLIKEYLEDEK